MRPSWGSALAGSLLIMWPLAQAARAHDIGEQLVRHQLIVQVGMRNIDFYLEVGLRPELALRERERIDLNGDGLITPDEQRHYLRELLGTLEGKYSVRIAGESLLALPLYYPEMDLQGEGRVTRSSLSIRLSFFVRTPQGFSGPILIESQIQRWQPAAHGLRATGKDGMEAWALGPPQPADGGVRIIYQVWGNPQNGW